MGLPPGYVRPPWSDERRAEASRRARERLGIKPGHCRVYGVDVPIELRDLVMEVLRRYQIKVGVRRKR